MKKKKPTKRKAIRALCFKDWYRSSKQLRETFKAQMSAGILDGHLDAIEELSKSLAAHRAIQFHVEQIKRAVKIASLIVKYG